MTGCDFQRQAQIFKKLILPLAGARILAVKTGVIYQAKYQAKEVIARETISTKLEFDALQPRKITNYREKETDFSNCFTERQ